MSQSIQLPGNASGSRPASWWGMLLLIINEGVIFVSLIGSYFYLRANSPIWPQDGLNRPELVIPFILTVILLTSSMCMLWGQKSACRGLLRVALLVAFVLGLAFLGLQAFAAIHSSFVPQKNAYASIFFGIIGLHWLHASAAVLINLYTLAQIWGGNINARQGKLVDISAMFWHFTVAAWLFILFALFLTPYL